MCLAIVPMNVVSMNVHRLSLESERERRGERLLERDLLCERLRGERDQTVL